MNINEIKIDEWYYFFSAWHKNIVIGKVKALKLGRVFFHRTE